MTPFVPAAALSAVLRSLEKPIKRRKYPKILTAIYEVFLRVLLPHVCILGRTGEVS